MYCNWQLMTLLEVIHLYRFIVADISLLVTCSVLDIFKSPQIVVVVDIFYLQHMICYKKGSTSKKSHRRDHFISIVDLTM